MWKEPDFPELNKETAAMRDDFFARSVASAKKSARIAAVSLFNDRKSGSFHIESTCSFR